MRRSPVMCAAALSSIELIIAADEDEAVRRLEQRPEGLVARRLLHVGEGARGASALPRARRCSRHGGARSPATPAPASVGPKAESILSMRDKATSAKIGG